MSAYVNVGECTIEESETEDVDWVNNWKKYFHQFYVDDILIIPSWEDVKPSDEDKWSSILIRVRHLEQECMRQPSFVSGRSEST